MKLGILLFAIVGASCFWAACSGGSVASAAKDTAPDNSTSSVSSSAGTAQFSYKIDGQSVSGGAIDALQEFNTAFTDDVDEGKELLFYLVDAKSEEFGSQPAHRLRFSVPCKTGQSSFGHDENGWGIEVDIPSDKDHTTRYFSDSFTISIASLSATRVSGTFSGKFNSENLDKKAIEITDGKFDIPFSSGVRPN
jgi:hypothetical protein